MLILVQNGKPAILESIAITMADTNPAYIYCYPRRDTDLLLFTIFTRELNEDEVNIYVAYVFEDGLKFIPDTLPVVNDANSMIIGKSQEIIDKVFTEMHVIGECEQCPILMYHGTVQEFQLLFE